MHAGGLHCGSCALQIEWLVYTSVFKEIQPVLPIFGNIKWLRPVLKLGASCVWNVGSRILILRTVWGRSNPWQQPDIDCVENMNPVELGKLMKHNDWNHKYLRVPVFLRDPVQAPKHNWKDLVNVLFDEAENVLIIPEVERSFCYLPERMTQHCWCKRFFSPARLIKETLTSAWVTVKINK